MEGINHKHIPDIIADRKRYEGILYTPTSRVYAELARRRKDPRLERDVWKYLHGNILEPLREQPRAVIARCVVSPNFEVRRFTELVRAHGKLEPLYLEYHSDSFTPNNESKHMLGRMFFYHGRGKHGGMKLESLNVVDFSRANGTPFKAIHTMCGRNFVDFHHELFDTCYERRSHTFFDTSDWLHARGLRAKTYYRAFLSLFVRHGVLFDNILLNDQERAFTMNVILPAFLWVYRRFGVRPLIVPLTPIKDEDSRLWMCYPGADKQFVVERTGSIA